MTDEDVLSIFKKTGAFLEGHFILTSGFHSPHYFQCAKVLQHPEYNTLFASEIAKHFKEKKIDVVVTPAVGGIVLGTEIGRILNSRNIFTERENGKMTLRRGFEINENENVLVCEDVVTTGGSVYEILDLVKEKKANLEGVGFIIDRSNGKIKFGCEQHSLASVEVIKFQESEIPDWLKNIPVTKPGSRALKQ
ncbi:MAG: orotate phosphoribosyltransferase [Ignavibacteriae bacterium]|nr:orotate phosphoribosyltransferase [Ignavibacteriota bacterium]